jgi:hypothetical protein
MDCYTEKVLFEHIEGCPGSQYKMKVVLVPTQFSTDYWEIKCLCSNKQTEDGHDIWFDAPDRDEKTLLRWTIRDLMKKAANTPS